jgi:hypothetical protein
MRLIRLAGMLPALGLLAGCAVLPLAGQYVSVNVPAEAPLPEALTLQLGGAAGQAAGVASQVMGLLGQENLEKTLGKKLKESAAPLRRAAADGFKKQLEAAKIFGSVKNEGGQLGIALGVGRWGLALNPQGKLEPVLDFEASLSAPGLGVVWKASRGAKDLGADVMAKAASLGLAQLAKNPAAFTELMALASADLSRQLVDDLRKNLPKAP